MSSRPVESAFTFQNKRASALFLRPSVLSLAHHDGAGAWRCEAALCSRAAPGRSGPLGHPERRGPGQRLGEDPDHGLAALGAVHVQRELSRTARCMYQVPELLGTPLLSREGRRSGDREGGG